MKSASRKRGGRLKIIVLGYIVRCPLGGMAWHYMQYVLGLERLGHDVYFVEDSDDYPCCYDPMRHVTDTDPSHGLAFTARVFDQIGLADRWAFYDAHTDSWHGPRGGDIVDISASVDLLLNISGANPIRPWLERVPIRIFIDTDPVFEQIRQMTVPIRRERARLHTHFFTFGENIVRPDTMIPLDGLSWKPTRQPVVLERWRVEAPPDGGRFTTVMQWESYPAREYRGTKYGLKSMSFESFVDLPKRAGASFELALGSPSAPRDRLRECGWNIRNPLDVTLDPWTYQRYIRDSMAEFTVAKHGYVTARSGWFSERSAVYLASGRPVLTQETGFSDWLPSGSGVVPFSTLEEAIEGVREITARYGYHCRAARQLAEAYFDSDKVLSALIETATCSGGTPRSGGIPLRTKSESVPS